MGPGRGRRGQSNIVIIVLAMLALGLAVALVVVLTTKQSKAPIPGNQPKPLPEPSPTPPEKTPPVDTPFASPQAVVTGYLEAKVWEDRLPYVLYQGKVRDIMETHYGRTGLLRLDEFKVLGSSAFEGRPQYQKVEARITPRETEDRKPTKHVYFVRKVENGYRIDWMASLGLNDFTLGDFQEAMPQEPKPYRVLIGLSTTTVNLFPSFSSLNFGRAVLLRRAEKQEIIAYIDKRSADGQRLLERLDDKKLHSLIVELSYDPEAQDSRGPIRIGRLISDAWVRPGP